MLPSILSMARVIAILQKAAALYGLVANGHGLVALGFLPLLCYSESRSIPNPTPNVLDVAKPAWAPTLAASS